MKKIFGLGMMAIALIFLFANCQNVKPSQDEELLKLADWMTGSFDSKAQSEIDTNFFNIHLEMVRIWEDRDDAIWLYIEQAASWALDKPYRQRVYRVSRKADGMIESAVFEMKDPLRFAGVWKEENPLNQLNPDSLSVREGCAIVMQFKEDAFIGSTVEKGCLSSLRGASYATSEVRIEPNLLTSWDRGFDAQDEQVWGAVTGPYKFVKK